MISDLEQGQGVWATRPASGGDFEERNLAQLKVEELPYSSKLEQELYSTFNGGCPVLAGFPDDLAKAAKVRRK